MSQQSPQPPQFGQHQPESAQLAPRPWFKKKRFIIPGAVVLLFGLVGSCGGGDDNTSPSSAQVAPEPEPTEKSAEEIAAEEEAEAERKAEEEAAAAAKAEEERLAEEQRVAEEAAAAAAAAAEEARKGTVSQQNAYRSAKQYLDYSAFSRSGLSQQLTSEYGEGFPAADAEFAIARLEAEGGVDWNAEAAESAKQYLDFSSFSRQGLLEQLTSQHGEGFTPEQAEYGVSTTGL